ncbi:MAG: MFS transporter [Armatimonadota bacterium]
MTTLSTQKTAHALRHFTMSGALWAIYGPNATPAGAIFAGYALSIGLTEPQIAFLVGLAALVGLWELFAFWASGPLSRSRWLMVGWGTVEITCASVVIFAYFLPLHLRFAMVAVFLTAAYTIGHTISPTFNSWLSNVMPEESRARYIGSRMFAISVTSMVYLYLASKWLDWQEKTYFAFLMVFLIGWVCGLLGYYILLVTPKPVSEETPEKGLGGILRPLRNRPFRILASYLVSWTVAGGLAGAFYGVYMIKYLNLPYSTIAIYTNITLATMMLGYLGAGGIAQRYGSKPLTQILIIPAALVPALWGFATLHSYRWLLPIACALNGPCIAGLGIAASNLLYKILPRGENNSVYFAAWGAAAAGGAAVGPFVGGLLKSRLPEQIMLGGMQFSALQAIFLLSGAAHVVAIILSNLLAEGEAASPIFLLGQFRGNLLNMAYNYGLYAVARKDQTRGEAMRRIGQSRSPLMVNHLVKGLGHVSREVRVGAVKGLGEGRFPDAVESLVQELTDKDSDIRAEAAEALGKIGAAHGHLYDALHDEDPRVRQSAAMGLSELQTPEAAQALRGALEETLGNPFDRNLFPTMVEATARLEDLRCVEPALEGLAKLTAPVVRMQVINGICRMIGEKNHFYRLATADDLAEGRMRERMMARIRRLLGRSRYGSNEQRARLRQLGQQIERALDADDLTQFSASAREIADLTGEMTSVPSVPLHAAHALRLYLDQPRPEHTDHELIVFLTVCLTSLSRNLAA